MQISHFILNNHLSKSFGNFVWCNCIDNIPSGILLVIRVFQVSSHSSRLSQMISPSKLLLKFHTRLFNWMRSIYIFTQFKQFYKQHYSHTTEADWWRQQFMELYNWLCFTKMNCKITIQMLTSLFFILLLQELFTVGLYDIYLHSRFNRHYNIVNIIIYFIHRLLLESY